METSEILAGAQELAPWLRQLRRELHNRAEVGFELPRTLEYVKDCLDELGPVRRCCGRAGLAADIGSGGNCFLLRADMDALPVAERSGLPFAAKNGCCHACGHDMHTAMLLGAARLLEQRKERLCGSVRLMFQPAEELLCGARDMIRDGILESPRPIGAAMLHVLPLPCGGEGAVMLSRPGKSSAAAEHFRISIRGSACHGAEPQEGRDPIAAAAHIISALQHICSGELPFSRRAVLSIGYIKSGSAPNIIPESLLMGGSIRSLGEDACGFVKKRMEEILQGVSAAFRLEAGLEFGPACPCFVTDGELAASAADCVRDMLGPAALSLAGEPSAASEDFAFVSREVPTVLLALRAGEKGARRPLHHPEIRFDESVLPLGAALLAAVAMKRLEEMKTDRA